MASFDSLQVHGIRSVGPDEKNVQVIKFDKPLTLIIGQNGCGKTTMIEALKYITTGELPSGKYQAFIHDPMLANKSRVDASVKLEFHDAAGRRCIATRRMSAACKQKTVKYGADEATIKHEKADGQFTSISSKQVDFNREMSNLLGVPKAILDYVVFCHQEESNWPLNGTNKDLKTKFDSIFQADHYVKAVETMHKLRKEYSVELKIIESNLVYLLEYRSDKLKMMKGLEQTGLNLQKNQLNYDVYRSELEPLDGQMKAIIEEMDQIRTKNRGLGTRSGSST